MLDQEIAGQATQTLSLGSDQTTVTPTGTTPEQVIKDLQDQIRRYQGTQSAADRAVAQMGKQKSELEQQLQDARSAAETVQKSFTESEARVQDMQAKLEELIKFKSSSESLEFELNRMKIVAPMCAANPEIALLVETNALPNTQTIEEFKAAMEKIAAGLSTSAQTKAQAMLTGAYVPVNPANQNEDPDEIEKRGYDLIAAHKSEEGIALVERAAELRKARQQQ
jgi:predicted RNase H-like nuclease (RuvC/YqgF family)